MPEEKLQKLVQVYMKGREESTLRSYESSFKMLGGLCEELGLSMFRLGEEARCYLWVEAREKKFSVAKVRGFSAVISLLKEVMGEEENISKREKTLKKALAKQSNLETTKRTRVPGTWTDVKKIMLEAERKNKRKEWRLAVMVVMCYFGCRRFSDIVKLKVKDVVITDEEVEVFMKKQKTDVFNEGDSFKMVAKGGDISLKKFLESYVERLGLKKLDSLFPRKLKDGSRVEAVSYSVMYKELEIAKTTLKLDENLTWHSFRIGAVTQGNALGIRRTVMKKAGNWKSEAVDIYCKELEAGIVLSRALLDDAKE